VAAKAPPLAAPAVVAPPAEAVADTPALPAAGGAAVRVQTPSVRLLLRLGLVVVVAVCVLTIGQLAFGSRAAPGATEQGRGIAFQPATLHCSNHEGLSISIRLPASVEAGDEISIMSDDVLVELSRASGKTVEDRGFVKQADGSWLYTTWLSSSVVTSTCSPEGLFTQGRHTWRVFSASRYLLSEGTLIVEP
jgi:hypothetical protein